MRLITSTQELEAFAAELAGRRFIAVDTEFMREKTFWPILCLIQAAAEGVEAIIDPLAEGIDLQPFLKMLTHARIVKVFHAARQDIEIFYRLTGAVPAPIFDTQIAAMACGFGDQIGYEPLIRTLTGARVDKGSRFTDWSQRPLSDAQLAYALSDVTHLREAYPVLRDMLKKQSRTQWVEEEMEALHNPELYYVDPETAWKRLKLKGVKANELGPVIKLAEWREHEAQSRDVPRSRILKDDAIFELARLRPKMKKDLARARSFPTGFERSSAGAAILSAIAAGREIPQAQLPEISRPERYKPSADILELLKVLLKRQCEHYRVAPKLVASAADLEEIARDDNADVPALKGWRREVFGDAALRLKRGEIALRLKNGSMEIMGVADA
jgi:ribonuclease D